MAVYVALRCNQVQWHGSTTSPRASGNDAICSMITRELTFSETSTVAICPADSLLGAVSRACHLGLCTIRTGC